jgi:hypothetical protein
MPQRANNQGSASDVQCNEQRPTRAAEVAARNNGNGIDGAMRSGHVLPKEMRDETADGEGAWVSSMSILSGQGKVCFQGHGRLPKPWVWIVDSCVLARMNHDVGFRRGCLSFSRR